MPLKLVDAEFRYVSLGLLCAYGWLELTFEGFSQYRRSVEAISSNLCGRIHVH